MVWERLSISLSSRHLIKIRGGTSTTPATTSPSRHLPLISQGGSSGSRLRVYRYGVQGPSAGPVRARAMVISAAMPCCWAAVPVLRGQGPRTDSGCLMRFFAFRPFSRPALPLCLGGGDWRCTSRGTRGPSGRVNRLSERHRQRELGPAWMGNSISGAVPRDDGGCQCRTKPRHHGLWALRRTVWVRGLMGCLGVYLHDDIAAPGLVGYTPCHCQSLLVSAGANMTGLSDSKKRRILASSRPESLRTSSRI